jgi:hypothetical protein
MNNIDKKNNKGRLTFIEEGRMNKEDMNSIIGGVSTCSSTQYKSFSTCSEAGPACPDVKGVNFVIIKNCWDKYYTCGSGLFRFCTDTSYHECTGNNDVKGETKGFGTNNIFATLSV